MNGCWIDRKLRVLETNELEKKKKKKKKKHEMRTENDRHSIHIVSDDGLVRSIHL